MLDVDADAAGQRLDNFDAPPQGRAQDACHRIIRSGEVRINKGPPLLMRARREGDQVRLPPVRVSDKVAEKRAPAPAHKFPLLLEDEHLIAIDKPAAWRCMAAVA